MIRLGETIDYPSETYLLYLEYKKKKKLSQLFRQSSAKAKLFYITFFRAFFNMFCLVILSISCFYTGHMGS